MNWFLHHRRPFSTVVGLLLLFCCFAIPVNSLIVSTGSGRLEGTQKYVGDTLTTSFLGIPYAQPPIGSLRFKKPSPVMPWEEVRAANNTSAACVQPHDIYGHPPANPRDVVITGSEDCLYLNVFQPTGLIGSHNKSRKAVMVWIHGGGFLTGSSSEPGYIPDYLMTDGNVIVVSINYRLSMLGFANLDSIAKNDSTESIPANLGMFDQQLALKWVHENIEYFEGDPDDITIFGESAGGASVTALLASSNSRQYFKNAIVQSGSHTCKWGSTKKVNIVRATRKTAELAGCDPEGNVLECLQKMDAEALVKAYFVHSRESKFEMSLTIANDDLAFFGGKNGLEAFADADLSSRSIMVGMTADEASFFLMASCQSMFRSRENTSLEEYQRCNEKPLSKLDPQQRNNILSYYSPPKYADRFQSTLALQTDIDFGCCGVHEVAKIVSRSADNTFVYVFDYVPGYAGPVVADLGLGAYHSIELQFVFGAILTKENRTETDAKMADRMIEYWSNFAKNGQPMSSLAEWPAVNRSTTSGNGSLSIPYKVIEANDSPTETVKRGFLKENCAILQQYKLGMNLEY